MFSTFKQKQDDALQSLNEVITSFTLLMVSNLYSQQQKNFISVSLKEKFENIQIYINSLESNETNTHQLSALIRDNKALIKNFSRISDRRKEVISAYFAKASVEDQNYFFKKYNFYLEQWSAPTNNAFNYHYVIFNTNWWNLKDSESLVAALFATMLGILTVGWGTLATIFFVWLAFPFVFMSVITSAAVLLATLVSVVALFLIAAAISLPLSYLFVGATLCLDMLLMKVFNLNEAGALERIEKNTVKDDLKVKLVPLIAYMKQVARPGLEIVTSEEQFKQTSDKPSIRFFAADNKIKRVVTSLDNDNRSERDVKETFCAMS